MGGMLAESPAGGAVPHLELAGWRSEHGLVAGITTREGDFHVANRGLPAWLALQAALDPRFPCIVVGTQVHGGVIRIHQETTRGCQIAEGVDGHATALPGVLLAVTLADCVPIYLAHPASGTIALLHAGWRGIAAGILEAGVATVTRLSKAPPADVIMHCGVGICGDCYDVGPEVFAALGLRERPEARHLDLRDGLIQRAAALGLGNATRSPWCSAHDQDRFFSHRRSGGRDGRMLAFVGSPAG